MSNYALSYIFKAIDEFSPAVAKMTEKIKVFEGQIEKGTKGFEKFSNQARAFGMGLFKYVVAPMAAIGIYALKNAENIELMRIKLNAFTGSAQSTAQIMGSIRSLALATGLNPEELGGSAAGLLRQGYRIDQINEKLRQMSVLSVVSGQSIESITSALGRINLTGSISTGLMARMDRLKIPLTKAFKEFYDISDANWAKNFKGKSISAALMEPVLASMTGRGSKFSAAYDERLRTMGSSLERIHVAIRYIAGDFGTVLMSTLGIDTGLQGIADKLASFAQKSKPFFESHRGFIKFLAIGVAIAAVIGGIAIVISSTIGLISIGLVGGLAMAYMMAKKLLYPFILIKDIVMAIVHGIEKISNFASSHLAGQQSGIGGLGSSSILSQLNPSNLNVNLNAPKSIAITQGGKTVGSVPFNVDKGTSNMIPGLGYHSVFGGAFS